MDKNSLDKKIKELEIGSKVIVSWDRGNGNISKTCIFKGYNPEKKDVPLFYPETSKVPLDLLKIGYENLRSIESSNKP